jgi:predicted DNA-binding ribbon-helix-helix protein
MKNRRVKRTRGMVKKRSLRIGELRTGVAVEDAFWSALHEIARERKLTISSLVSAIKADNHRTNLSAAIRVFVLRHYMDQNKRAAGSHIR